MNSAHLCAFDRELLKIFHLSYRAEKKVPRQPIKVVGIKDVDGIQGNELINEFTPQCWCKVKALLVDDQTFPAPNRHTKNEEVD